MSINFNKYAFAQQNPVLPNYRGDQRTIGSSKILYNQTNLASSDIQPKSLVHYQPITPAVHDYIGNSNSKSISSFPTLTRTNMINSTSPSSFVQPVSLTQYQPITPAGSTNPLPSPENIDNEHASTNNDGGGHHSSKDNGHDGASHSDNAHHGSSSNHNNNDHDGRTSHHSSGHHHEASASASAGGSGAFASASAG